MTAIHYAGIDLGSSSIKGVIIDANGHVVKSLIRNTSLQLSQDITAVQNEIQSFTQHPNIMKTIAATGYGRKCVDFADLNKPEVLCHAKGCYHYYPHAFTLIDIGGQDNKIIQVNEEGQVTLFKMNTKCAAGTGAFLEEIANRAKLTMDQLHGLALNSQIQTPINSFCTVFAMTEVLKKIVEGEKLEDIARGVFLSITERIREIYRSSNTEVVLSGGVVQHNPLLRSLIKEKLGVSLFTPENPQFTGALGAALFAREAHHEGET